MNYKLKALLPVSGNPRIMAISGIFFTSATAMWIPFFPIYLYNLFEYSATQIGLLYSLSLFFSLVMPILGGVLADRYGRKKPVIISNAGIVISMLFITMMILQNARDSSILKMTVGFSYIAFIAFISLSSAARSLLLTEWKKGSEGRSLSAIYTLPSFIAIPFPFLAVFLYTINPAYPIIAPAILYICVFFIQGIFLRETLSMKEKKKTGSPNKKKERYFTLFSGDKKRISKLKTILPAFFFVLLVIYSMDKFAGKVSSPFTALFFLGKFGVSLDNIALLIAGQMFVMGVVSSVSGKIIDSKGAWKLMIFSFLVEGVLAVVIIASPFFALALAVYWIKEGVDYMDIMAPTVLISKKIRPERRAKALSYFGIITAIFGMPGCILGGLLFSMNVNMIFIPEIFASFFAVGAILCFISIQSKNKKLETVAN